MATALVAPSSARGNGTKGSADLRFGGVHGSRLTPYLFLLPYLLLFAAFVVVPAVYGIWISLHDWDFMLPDKPFVGLQNYKDLTDPQSVIFEPFWNGMRATAIFTVASVPFLIVVPLLIALLLNRKFPGRTFFRAMIFAPFVLGIAVVGVLWQYLLDAQFGLINYLLGAVGLPPIGWLQTQPW
ncbi:MAG TPA: sugar ABC transporter permease, partial [Propionibacteriaceae bacterium]